MESQKGNALGQSYRNSHESARNRRRSYRSMGRVHSGQGVKDNAILAPLAAIAIVVLLSSGRFSQFQTWVRNFITGATTTTSPLVASPLNYLGGLQGQGNQTLNSTELTPSLPAGWTGGFTPPPPAPPSQTGILNLAQPSTVNAFLGSPQPSSVNPPTSVSALTQLLGG